ncbi:hypothetical protein V8E53_012341 [Lactarius tabidus]
MAVLRGLIDRRALVPACCVVDMLSEKFRCTVDGNAVPAGGNPRTNALLHFLWRLEMEGPNVQPEPADVAILARAVDDWQQEHYLYPFHTCNSQCINPKGWFGWYSRQPNGSGVFPDGDRIETREGRTICINMTSDLAAVIVQLKEKQWDKILKAAQASGKIKKRMMQMTVSKTPEPSEVPLVELRDDDSDLMDED